MDHVTVNTDQDTGAKIMARPFTLTGHPFVVTAVSDPQGFGFDQVLVTVSCCQGLGQVVFKADPQFWDQLHGRLPESVLDAADQLYTGKF